MKLFHDNNKGWNGRMWQFFLNLLMTFPYYTFLEMKLAILKISCFFYSFSTQLEKIFATDICWSVKCSLFCWGYHSCDKGNLWPQDLEGLTQCYNWCFVDFGVYSPGYLCSEKKWKFFNGLRVYNDFWWLIAFFKARRDEAFSDP